MADAEYTSAVADAEYTAAVADADDADTDANEDVNIGGCEVRLIGWVITRGASTNDRRPPGRCCCCRKSNKIFTYSNSITKLMNC